MYSTAVKMPPNTSHKTFIRQPIASFFFYVRYKYNILFRLFIKFPVPKFKTQLFPNAFFIVFFTRIGDRKAYQPDGMMLVVHFLQQLLCQWKNGIERGQAPGLRNAAGDLTEIMELIFSVSVFPRKFLCSKRPTNSTAA